MNTKLHGIILFLIATLLFAIHDATSKYLIPFFAIPLLRGPRVGEGRAQQAYCQYQQGSHH